MKPEISMKRSKLNPIYSKLQRIFFSQKRQQRIIQDEHYRGEKYKMIKQEKQALYQKKLKSQIQSITQPSSKCESIDIMNSSEYLNMQISRQQRQQSVKQQNLQFIKLANSKIYQSYEYNLKDSLVQPKNNYQTNQISEISKRQSFQKYYIQKNPSVIQIINQKNTSIIQIVDDLTRKLNYYEKMEEFYLQQLGNYKQDKKQLQWKLKIIMQEALNLNKKKQNDYLSFNTQNKQNNYLSLNKKTHQKKYQNGFKIKHEQFNDYQIFNQFGVKKTRYCQFLKCSQDKKYSDFKKLSNSTVDSYDLQALDHPIFQ